MVVVQQGEIAGLKANDSIIVAQTDYRRNVVFDPNGNPVSNAIGWKVTKTDHGQGESPVWSIAPKLDIVLQRDDYIPIYISNIKTSLPSGLTNLYLDYKRIPGFWDGQVVCPIEKAPLLFYDVKDKFGRQFLELRLAADMVEIEEDATEPAKDSVEGVIAPAEEHLLAEAKKSLREIAALLNEIETRKAIIRASCEWGLDASSPRRSWRSPWRITMLIRSRW